MDHADWLLLDCIILSVGVAAADANEEAFPPKLVQISGIRMDWLKSFEIYLVKTGLSR